MRYVKKLTKESKQVLYDIIRNNSNYRVRNRAHVILLSAKKFKIDQLSLIFDVDRDTVSEWIRRWEEKGLSGLTDASRPGRPPKHDKSQNLNAESESDSDLSELQTEDDSENNE